jgi:hypothetical protein
MHMFAFREYERSDVKPAHATLDSLNKKATANVDCGVANLTACGDTYSKTNEVVAGGNDYVAHSQM